MSGPNPNSAMIDAVASLTSLLQSFSGSLQVGDCEKLALLIEVCQEVYSQKCPIV